MIGKFLDEKKTLAEIKEDSTIDDIMRTYSNKIDSLDKDDQLRKYFIWDYEILRCCENTMHLEDSKSNRLGSYIEYTDGYKYPDIEKFEHERKDFYDACLDEENNLNMKIRYLDYLVDYGDSSKKYKYACELVKLLIENNKIEDYNDAGECLKYISRLSRAVDISVSFGMKENIEKLENHIKEKVSLLVEVQNYRWILEISQLLRCMCYNKKDKRISQKTIDYIIYTLEISRRYYYQQKNMNLNQAFSWELINWIKKENINDIKINELLLDIGKAYENEAEYQGGAVEKSYHTKASFLELAVAHYIRIGARDKVYDLKVKIKEAYRLGKDEVIEQTYNLDIPNPEIIEAESERFILDNIDDSFELFSKVGVLRFIPKKSDLVNSANERQSNSIINLIGISKISNDRKIFDANNESEREKYFLCEEYNYWLQLMFSIMYDRIWIKLEAQGLNSDMVIDRITGWECMSDTDAEIIKVGIERYFNEDFISALHILVPRFENCFREFFAWGGYPTTSIKKSAVQHEQTFNEFLENDFVKENIDSDVLYLIKYVMVENLGYNLRNDIAHGLIQIDKFNRNIANIVLCLYFILTSLCWEIKNK